MNPATAVIRRGAFAELPQHCTSAVAAARWIVVSDSNVTPLHGARALDALRGAGLAADLVEIPAGEASKTRETWGAASDRVAALGAGRDVCIVAVGGGVTTDMAGFVAATYMRGVPWIVVPTSLLAMIDAAWGGKTGVDTPAGKNLIGSFHAPAALVADPALLDTLPHAELRAGLAEAVKHGAIADADHVAWLEREAGRILSREPEPLDALVAHSASIKRGFVERDPLEGGPRSALNFGHTVGHALEALSGYRLAHGPAVAIGMVAEAHIGVSAGVTEPGTPGILVQALTACGLPVLPPPELRDPERVVSRAASDKKGRRGRTRYALLARTGVAAGDVSGDWSSVVPDGTVLAALRAAWLTGTAGSRLSSDIIAL